MVKLLCNSVRTTRWLPCKFHKTSHTAAVGVLCFWSELDVKEGAPSLPLEFECCSHSSSPRIPLLRSADFQMQDYGYNHRIMCCSNGILDSEAKSMYVASTHTKIKPILLLGMWQKYGNLNGYVPAMQDTANGQGPISWTSRNLPRVEDGRGRTRVASEQ